MDIVLSRASAYQLKEFTKVQGISSINLDTPSYKDHQSIGIIGRLNIHTFDTMLDLSHRIELVDDILCSLELLAFKCQHGRWRLMDRVECKETREI